ncbi:MAG TPA: ammonium transporter [Aestuariivirgaceae bacterium]|jgi:Amt family ammonium transporter
MVVATGLVFLMTIPGLALFYGGMVRKFNVLATLMQCFAICCAVSLVWMIVGYSLAFTPGTGFLGGLSRIFLMGLSPTSAVGTIPETVFVMFQMSFAVITPALITGAFADRMKFSALLLFTVLWSIAVYAPIAHWAWEATGWLFVQGVLDFAGGTVVHINAGVAGLIAAIVIGRRNGYPLEPFLPHNLVLSVIGASFLWIGWFGFNAGSALTAGPRAGMALAATHIAASAAALSWLAVEWWLRGKPSVLGGISGAVAGLVAITPAAGYVDPSGALIIGLIAGIVCFWGASWLKHKFGYDDSLDCFGIHGVGGIVGALLTGIFAKVAIANSEGLYASPLAENPNYVLGLIEGNLGQLWIQIVAVAATIAWCAIATFVILKLIDLLIGLRVDRETEQTGLDLALHGEAVR